MEVIQECLARYENVAVAFNGGKESMVVAYMCLQVPGWRDKKKVTWFTTLERNPHPEMLKFLRDMIKRWNLNVIEYECDLKTTLASLVNDHGVEAVIMGTRMSDPHGTHLDYISETTSDWPRVMRVNPILKWSYDDVWEYISQEGIPSCILYLLHGYTSIGNASNSFPNYLLWNDASKSWRHARDLTLNNHVNNEEMERVGRIRASLPIKIQGKVVRGEGRGKGLGFPTANLDLTDQTASIENMSGVFCGMAKFSDSDEIFQHVCSIGMNVTFDSEQTTIEVHLLRDNLIDFYDATLEVTISRFIRPMLKFTSVEELVKAIQRDVEIAKF